VDRQEMIEYLLDHYESPRNKGPLEDPDVIMPGGNPGCGDVVTIYLKVDQEAEKVERLSFEGAGCTISQAAASILSEMMSGAELNAIEELDYNDMMDTLGHEVVKSRPRCATLALGTLKAAVKKYRNDLVRKSLGMEVVNEVPERFEI
jgi:nitrogen fixation NifU-like protein